MQFRIPKPEQRTRALNTLQAHRKKFEAYAERLENSGLAATNNLVDRELQFLTAATGTLTRLALQNDFWPGDLVEDARKLSLPAGFDFADFRLRSAHGHISRESIVLANRMWIDVTSHIETTRKIIQDIREAFAEERRRLSRIEDQLREPESSSMLLTFLGGASPLFLGGAWIDYTHTKDIASPIVLIGGLAGILTGAVAGIIQLVRARSIRAAVADSSEEPLNAYLTRLQEEYSPTGITSRLEARMLGVAHRYDCLRQLLDPEQVLPAQRPRL